MLIGKVALSYILKLIVLLAYVCHWDSI